MNFFGRFTKEERRRKVESKAMFERKFCLAKADPDPSFDLSECGLETVPSSVFKFVQVLRKTALLLQKNELKSLGTRENMKDMEMLETLMLSSNKLTTLPYDINFLKFLKFLDISCNQLVQLPDTICELTNLEVLNLAQNKLSRLPDNIGRLTKLQHLNIENNLDLKILPLSLHHACNLMEISWSENQCFSSPPQSVVCQGVAQILTYLAEECDSGCDKDTHQTFLVEKDNGNKLASSVFLQKELEARLNVHEQQRKIKVSHHQ